MVTLNARKKVQRRTQQEVSLDMAVAFSLALCTRNCSCSLASCFRQWSLARWSACKSSSESSTWGSVKCEQKIFIGFVNQNLFGCLSTPSPKVGVVVEDEPCVIRGKELDPLLRPVSLLSLGNLLHRQHKLEAPSAATVVGRSASVGVELFEELLEVFSQLWRGECVRQSPRTWRRRAHAVRPQCGDPRFYCWHSWAIVWTFQQVLHLAEDSLLRSFLGMVGPHPQEKEHLRSTWLGSCRRRLETVEGNQWLLNIRKFFKLFDCLRICRKILLTLLCKGVIFSFAG